MADEPSTPDPVPGEAAVPPVQPPHAGSALVVEPESATEATAPEAPADAPVEVAAQPPPNNKRWYVVKIQSGREKSIKEAIERRVKIEGLEEYFGQIVIPVEKVTEMKNGKRVVKERHLFPGYLMVEVEYNDRILYLFRETSGVGDFVGGSVSHPPSPMSDREVARMIDRSDQVVKDAPSRRPPLDRGDRVKVRDGTFSGMEGEVKEVLEAKACVRVELTIFGRGVPVELEYWQVEHV